MPDLDWDLQVLQRTKRLKRTEALPRLPTNSRHVSEFVFDPEKKGLWHGDMGLAQVFLKEYIVNKYKNTCTTAKVEMIQFDKQSGGTAIYVGSDKTITLKEVTIKTHFEDILKNARVKNLLLSLFLFDLIRLL